MTVAAKENPGVGKTKKGGLLRALTGHKSPWRRLWQVPLLLAGVVAFAFGLRALKRTRQSVPFPEQLRGIRSLLTSGQYAKAVEQINMMGDYYKQAGQQSALQELAGDAHFLAERQQLADGSVLVRTNYEWTEKHYENAVRLGLPPSVQMNERWSEAALALGQPKEAAEKLEAAMSGAGETQRNELVRDHAKELVAAYLEIGQRDRALEMVDRLLAAQAALDDKKATTDTTSNAGGNADGGEMNSEENSDGTAGGGGENNSDPASARAMEAIEDTTWALCKRIEIALAGHDAAAISKAVDGARGALGGSLEGLKEHDPTGRVLAWIGRAELEQGNAGDAETDLLKARSLFAVHHVDDGRAAVLLGKIALAKGELDHADKLFQEVVTGQAGTSVWAAARLGRAQVAAIKAAKGKGADEQAFGDYQFAIDAAKELEDEKNPAPVGKKPELISAGEVQESLAAAYQRSVGADQLTDALRFLALEKQLSGPETADMAYQLATTTEKRGDEAFAQAEKLAGAQRAAGEAAARQMWADAAEAYLRHAKLTTLEDEQSGASLWKAAELLDRAGNTNEAMEVYERLTIQRPRDPREAEGMYALGRLYESAGMLEKAVETHERNLKENSKTPAAYASAVDLARCYRALGDKEQKPEEKRKDYGKAEETLLAMVQDDTNLTPEARQFRESLQALGELYYQSKRWQDAILRLDELIKRYPSDAGVPHALFLLAESYRKSALEIGEALKADPAIDRRADLEGARVDRLRQAGENFTRVISVWDSAGPDADADTDAGVKKTSALDAACLQTAYMDRADCSFELGDFPQAIKLYEQVASRFAEDTAAADAYVQIVNAYLAMKQPAEANAAALRGQWVLKRIPDVAFGQIGPRRAYYEKLLAFDKN